MNPLPAPNGFPRFQIEASAKVHDAIKQCQRVATLDGRGIQFASAFRQILKRLQTNPSRFGEELFHLRALHLRIRCAVIRPVYIDFGVSEDRRVVYLRIVKLLAKPGHR